MANGPAPIEPSRFFSDLHPGAIVLGFVVDNVATVLSTIVIWLVLLGQMFRETQEEFSDEAFDAVANSPESLVATALVGTLCTVLGGYVAARRAAVLHVRHGALVGAADIVLGLALLALLPPDPGDYSLWYDLLGFLVVIPAGMVGGSLAARRERAATLSRNASPRGIPPWSS